ncbi:unnamed protein product [Adineta ricciae]|uniref:Uncharacterized protein n=1 Tax=Adineta ricciae TaxID=249248 RepID=A0A814VDZ9_ADIRI|nr:unnamed protein product [Adineta ricciae]
MNMYTPTTCLLLNYTVQSHQCEDCSDGSCKYYTCYNEFFQATYPIANGTYIISTTSSIDRSEQHQQTQINNAYKCFYQLDNVILLLMELPNNNTNLCWVASAAIAIVGLYCQAV